MKLPIAGQRRQAGKVSAPLDSAQTPISRTLALIPAYPAAPVWSLVGPDFQCVYVQHGEEGLSLRQTERPRPHTRVSGSRAQVVAHLETVAQKQPVVLMGPMVHWIKPSLTVLFAGSLGRHSWTPECRGMAVDLVLRDVRPAVIRSLLRSLVS